MLFAQVTITMEITVAGSSCSGNGLSSFLVDGPFSFWIKMEQIINCLSMWQHCYRNPCPNVTVQCKFHALKIANDGYTFNKQKRLASARIIASQASTLNSAHRHTLPSIVCHWEIQLQFTGYLNIITYNTRHTHIHMASAITYVSGGPFSWSNHIPFR